MHDFSWDRALNLLSGVLLLVCAVARWGTFLIDEQDIGCAAALTAGALSLLLVHTLRPDWRPGLAAVLLALVAVCAGLVALAWEGESTGLDHMVTAVVCEAPTLLLALAVVLSNRRATAIITLAAVLLVAGSGYAVCASARGDPWGGVAVVVFSLCQAALALVVATVAGIVCLATRSADPAKKCEPVSGVLPRGA